MCQFEPLIVRGISPVSVTIWIPPVCYIGEHLAKLNFEFMSHFTLPQTTSAQNKQPDVGTPLTALRLAKEIIVVFT